MDGWREIIQGLDIFMQHGEVIGKVKYSKKEKMSLNQISVNETGKVHKNYKIKFNNFTINLNKTLPKFKNYDIINEEKKLKLFSNFYLPISLGISTYYEIEEKENTLTKEEAKEILINKLKSQLSKEINNEENILNVIVNSTEDETSVEVEVIYEVRENIGTEEKIIE